MQLPESLQDLSLLNMSDFRTSRDKWEVYLNTCARSLNTLLAARSIRHRTIDGLVSEPAKLSGARRRVALRSMLQDGLERRQEVNPNTAVAMTSTVTGGGTPTTTSGGLFPTLFPTQSQGGALVASFTSRDG